MRVLVRLVFVLLLVLAGKAIDDISDIDHEYFVQEAGHSLYSFKT